MRRYIMLYTGFWSLIYSLPHELSHWAVARLGTDDAGIKVEVKASRCSAEWPPLENAWLRFFAFLAPTIFGSVLALVWLFSDTNVDGWRLIFAIGLAWYTVPSPGDVRGALGRQEVQQDNDTTQRQTDGSHSNRGEQQ
jgi:hypothetical protein